MSVVPDYGEWPTGKLPDSWAWADFTDAWVEYTDSRRKLPKKDYQTSGRFAVVDQGEDLIGGFTDDDGLLSGAPLPCIVWGDHTKCVKYIDRPFVQGADGVKVLATTGAIFPEFAYLALKAINLPDKGYSRHFKFLRASRFPIPPIAEQHRIAAKLDSLFARTRSAREELARIPRLIEHYKQAILAAAFRGAVEAAERIVPLGDLAIEVRNGLSKKPADAPPGTPILRISAVRPLSVDFNDRRYYSPNEEVPKRALLANEDLLFTRYNGNAEFVAVCGRVEELAETLTYPDKLIRVRLVQEVAPSFVELICAAPQARDALRPFIKTAAGQHGISGKDLKQLRVPVPTLETQRELNEVTRGQLTAIAALSSEHGAAVRLLNHIDQSTLAKAFRGELVPQDPDDEPAAVLLERIRAARAAEPKPKRQRRTAAAG